MRINNQKVIGDCFAYDGCHKIYICEDLEDEEKMIGLDYDLYPIEQLQEAYDNSCSLRFIENAKLTTTYVAQFEEAVFN